MANKISDNIITTIGIALIILLTIIINILI